MSLIDSRGYRANVGLVITDGGSQLLWARRVGQDAWQFPQGGVNVDESLEGALYRELYEEVGLLPGEVTVISQSVNWLYYKLPERLIRYDSKPVCIGQKQWWFLLQLQCDEARINLSASNKPEFDAWKWVSYWYPLREVVAFKREVYRRALKEFAPIFFGEPKETEALDPIFADLIVEEF